MTKTNKNTQNNEPEVLLNHIQACLELKIIGYYKGFVFKKYKNKSFFLSTWKEKLKKDGLDIK
jgi:hypothetical protein